MCGIFGYVGQSRAASDAVMDGLRKLDYRGYDSWGVAVLNGNGIDVKKKIGIVTREPVALHGNIGIGHTRWATHGAVTDANAHPHYASDRSFALAHNGIVENMHALKAALRKKNYRFISETDTETIVYLIEEKKKNAKNLTEALRLAFKELQGRNTVIVLANDGQVIGARNGSPLVVGIGEKPQEIYFSSDVLSFSTYVKGVVVLENGQMAETRGDGLRTYDIATGKSIRHTVEKNAIIGASVDKGGYEHYMLKEIMDTPQSLRAAAAQTATSINKLASVIKKARSVYTIGSGTAGAAAAQTAFYLREYGKVHATSLIGAEASEYYDLFGKGDVMIALSQSGETADVLEVLELAKKKGVKIVSYVNMPGSMMTRMSDLKFMAEAGPEICVMSTKIFTSQIAWGYLVAKAVQGKAVSGRRNLGALIKAMEKFIKNKVTMSGIQALAAEMAEKNHLFLLAKGQNLQIAREAMVKIIEGSYIHAHAIPAGDLKHYAITLMETGTPVIAIVSNDDLLGDVANAMHEVRARGADTTGIAPQPSDEFNRTLVIPDTKETSAIMNIIPLQLLAYYMAVHLGNNVDKPRNIAKSVTVK